MSGARDLLRRHRDVWVCALLVTLISCASLWRLGLLWPSSEQEVLVVDTARTALVAKNLVDGNGYTTNDLPASLVSFYDQQGRLHEEHWLNADRFPFGAYATAALYEITGRRDAWTGVILYNLITFVVFLTALYVFARRITGSRVGGALAVGLSLVHAQTYVFLFMKDADMLMLAVFTLSCFHAYLSRPLEARSTRQMIWFGTVLAWSFLSRPNVGAPFMVALLVVSLMELARGVRRLGGGPALARWARTDVVAGAVATLWLLPFLIHTLAAWGSPFFSANGLYQPALGTRFGMGTDTWWRYFPKDFDYSVGHLWREARGDVVAKFTTSWMATLKTFVSAYFVELALALGALRVPRATPTPGLRGAIIATLVVFAFNFVLLPLYSYKDYSWRHYLAFVLPVLWLGAAMTLLHIGRWLAPTWETTRAWIERHPREVVAGVGVVLLLVVLRAPGNDGNLLLMGVSRFLQKRWLLATCLLLFVAALPRWRRWSGTTWLLVVSTVAVIALYRPHKWHKNFTHIHVPASNRVWKELGQRHGLVASFALQTQVSWNTGRKNIPAPELVMNLYEMMSVHQLEFEDLYIESPEAQLTPFDGLFGRAAPGFEGYLRLVTYRDHLPGYRLAFHEEGKRGRPRYRIAPRQKSSTVYTLSDRAALAELLRTPTVLEVGDVARVVHTAHGFGGYYQLDGRPVVAATDATRKRYTPQGDQPWEDTSVTFFVDDRRPAQVTIAFYAVAANTFTFYWNLDLHEYTPAGQRARHQLGVADVKAPGWQSVTLTVPPALVRRGVNKLGFRAAQLPIVALCDRDGSEALCAAAASAGHATALVRATTTEPATVTGVSMLLHRLDFDTTAR